MKHIVKIFNLTNNTSYQRLRLILAEPSVEIRLIKRLLKIYHKYRDHFGVSADKYREQLLEQLEDDIVDGDCDKTKCKELYKELEYNELQEIFDTY